jgi:beta-galactosidase
MVRLPAVDRRQFVLTGAATLALAHPAFAATPKAPLKTGRAQPFDLDWRFHRGAGEGFEAARFDDSAWRGLDLPHDWSIEDLPPAPDDPKRIVGPFDRDAVGGNLAGYVVGGEGWYRKRFHLADPKPGRVELVFDGVYMNSDVWINGRHVGGHVEGYTPFALDLTPHLSDSGDNVVALRVRSLGFNARWHAGAGVHRHVWLDVLPEPARIARWGVGVVTRRISGGDADVEVETRIDNPAAGLTLVSRVKDHNGRIVWEETAPAQAQARQALTLGKARLWSPEQPNLYTLETELRRGHAVLDQVETPFGVRVITFDATRGMALNGAPTKLCGGCIHHDNGLLGAAAFDLAEERKVALLKARGFNAVRPSHNLFSPAFLSACDRLGMMVICESFDVWREHKIPADLAGEVFDQIWSSVLETIVLSARNHPSIIMWSIGNEIPGRNTPQGIETQWRLANAVHRLDRSRPVTAALNGFPGHVASVQPAALRPGASLAPDRTGTMFLDVVGYNYKLPQYEPDHALFPERVFFGSESFPKDVFAIWDLTERSPWLIGDFVWTAMDYLGEVSLGGSDYVSPSAAKGTPMSATWPWISAYCGDIDLIGQQAPASLARDVVWGVSPLEIAVQRPVPVGKAEALRLWGWSDELQSWTWPGAEGRELAVRIYTAGDRVELRLNGRAVVGKAVTPADQKHIELKIAYAPGKLEAVAFRGEREIARRGLETVGPAVAVRIRPERPSGGAGRGDVTFVVIEVIDAQGRLVPDASLDARISVRGPGELIAFGSANPKAVGSLQAPQARTWRGRALAVLRGQGAAGRVTIDVICDGAISGRAALRLV